jgi:hypothetical protein
VLDLPNQAEEIESIARREKRELTNCLVALLTGLVRRSQRQSPDGLDPRLLAELILQDSPSLQPRLPKPYGAPQPNNPRNSLNNAGLSFSIA